MSTKIIFTSDIHYPTTNSVQIQSMLDKMKKDNPDVIILGGDLAEVYYGLNYFNYIVKLFVLFFSDAQILVFSGNHDLYRKSNTKYNSRDLWDFELKRRAEEEGAVWLEDVVWKISHTAIVGSYVHYDYSAADKSLKLNDEYYAENKPRVMKDGSLHVGLPDDKEFAKEIGDKFCDRIKAAQEDDNINNIIVSTHVPVLEAQITRKTNDFNWSASNAYFGNLSYTKLLLGSHKIKYVLSGHSHVGKEVIIGRGNMDDLISVNLNVDYYQPNYYLLEI